jgi:hypothetical protein
VVLTWGGFDSGNEDTRPIGAQLERDHRVEAGQTFGLQVGE